MLGDRFGRESTRVDEDPVVIGLFQDATDARWALQALHENHYPPDQITAAFQTPADSRAEAEGSSVAMRGSGKWFGQLREIYRGEDGGVGRTGERADRVIALRPDSKPCCRQIHLLPGRIR